MCTATTDGNEGLICVREKPLDKLSYCNIKMKHIKIRDTRIRKKQNVSGRPQNIL